MRRESELQLEHALNSVTLIHDIRSVLTTLSVDRPESSKEAISLVGRIAEMLKNTPEFYLPMEWRLMASGLRVLASHVTCLRIAQLGEGDLVTERARCDLLFGDFRRLLSSETLKLPESIDSTRHSLRNIGLIDLDQMRFFLLLVPMPTLFWHVGELSVPNSTEPDNSPANPLLRIIVFLDHTPITSPQLLKSNIVYPVVFRVRGLVWPAHAVRLRLDLLTTCPPTVYSVSEFTLDKPEIIENDEYQGELTGQIIFNSAQSSLMDDLVFTIRGAFEFADGHFAELHVIGHNELRLRVTNENTHPLMTGNRRLDQHIDELVTKLLKDCPLVRDELTDLFTMLQALTRLLATYAQEAVYKGRNDVSESEFQVTVLRDLRFILGQEVQDHPVQAGGITDIRYRGVIVELKVEKANGDRQQILQKYTSQPVQYAGVEARQVSILLVLDLTSKDKPPGDIRNDMLLADVESHGGSDEGKLFPSKVFVFVINGI